MSDQRLPDITDPDIRRMVLLNHAPEETWLLGKDGPYALVHCGACMQSWPCPSIKAARTAEGRG